MNSREKEVELELLREEAVELLLEVTPADCEWPRLAAWKKRYDELKEPKNEDR